MPKRVHLHRQETDWTASVAGERITLGGDAGAFDVREVDGQWTTSGPGGDARGVAARDGDVVWVQIDGEVFDFRVTQGARRGGSRDADAFSPPMPATVVRIAVAVGDTVKAGDVLIALEAMKMELPIKAPRDGVVSAIHCAEGDLVQPGTVLIEI
ncbi:MAG: biotin/lipoyl-containing protein [Vicinamibacterales bacterium]